MKNPATVLEPSFTTASSLLTFDTARTVRYVGPVTRGMNERALAAITKHVTKAPEVPVTLFVTSTGGPTGAAMSFYDTLRYIIRPNLITIGSGDVDSSGIIVFLAGDRRYVTARTTLLLHPAGRVFGNQRYTTKEMEAMLAEDSMKDEQYASVLAERSHGKLTTDTVLSLMERHTVLSPSDLVAYGLADDILV